MEDLKEKFFRIYYSKIDEEDDYKKLDYIYYSIFNSPSIKFRAMIINKEINIISEFNYFERSEGRDIFLVDTDVKTIKNYIAKIEYDSFIYYLYPRGILTVTVFKFASPITYGVDIRTDSKETAEKILKESCLVIKERRTLENKNSYDYVLLDNGSLRSIGLTFKDFDFRMEGYNKDFPVDKINEFVKSSNREGLMLFYGEPGTGKTTYIKHLIQENRDIKFVLLDNAFLAAINNREFLNLLIDRPDSIYVLEDCEKALLKREEGYSNVNTLINLTDGILGSTLNTKFICTFNTPLNKIDKALLRKGRLFLKYRFRKLDGKRLTVSELYNSEENDFSKDSETNKIGF
jgi:hypothetical protein